MNQICAEVVILGISVIMVRVLKWIFFKSYSRRQIFTAA